MNFKKLAAWLTLSATAATPLAIAQNPTILQGSYISNVFGNSNFVLNPNAQTNTANVTNATRSTTTPLVATSEFTLSLASGANATWTLRAFDQGMKGQNCEARFTYRGFATATTKAEIVQNSLVVASLTLTPTTDPRIASINFPCGDLAHLTTFRIAQTTANMTTVTPNEIGGIYVGLATNMANVSQLKEWESFTPTVPSAITLGTGGTITGQQRRVGDSVEISISVVLGTGGLLTAGPVFSLPSGLTANTAKLSATSDANIGGLYAYDASDSFRIYEGNTRWSNGIVLNFHNTTTTNASNPFTWAANDQIHFRATIPIQNWNAELVVTPERQNVFGGVTYNGNSDFSGTATSITNVTDTNFGSRTFIGNASASATSCGLNTNDFGFCMTNVPPGTYVVGGNLEVGVVEAGADKSWCNYRIKVGGTTLGDTEIINAIPHSNASNAFVGIGTGIIKINSFQQNLRVFLQYNKDAGADSCSVRSFPSGTLVSAIPSLHIRPIDQPSNSALYVQGPVKAAETGAAIPAGYVGEKIVDGVWNMAAGCTGGANTRTLDTPLPPGVWLQQTTIDNANALTGNFHWYTTNSNIGYQEIWGTSGSALRTQWNSEIAVFNNTSTKTSYNYSCSNTTGNFVYVNTIFIRLN